MLGSTPLAVTPLATLIAAGGAVTTDTEFATTLTTTSAFVGETVTVVSADATVTLALSPSFDSETVTVVESDLSAGAALSASFDSETVTISESDFSTALALSSSWDVIPQQISSADMSTTLALSTSWDSAFSTVVGSTWSVVINPAVGPVQAPVTISAPGSGYNLGDQLRINGGNNDAIVTVVARSGTGVLGVSLTNAGSGYTSGYYTTTAITGTGIGCQVSLLADTAYTKWRSGATKGSRWAPAPTLTTTGRALSFATTVSATTAAVTADMVSGATAGSVASTSDAATVLWDGLAIGPVPVDWTVVLQLVTSWSGQRIKSGVAETVHVGQVLTEGVNVGRSLEDSVKVGE
jgi:hypothetical protein